MSYFIAGYSEIHIFDRKLLPLVYVKIVVVHKVEEPLYDMLSNDIRPNDVVFITDLDDLPKPDELAEHLGLTPKDQILVVFDDCMADKHQDMITQFYIRGRKSNISSFYLSQKFYAIPNEIRAQFNYLLVLKFSDNREIKSVLRQYGLEVTPKEIMKMYNVAVALQFGFLKIDIYNPDPKCKCSKGFKMISVFCRFYFIDYLEKLFILFS